MIGNVDEMVDEKEGDYIKVGGHSFKDSVEEISQELDSHARWWARDGSDHVGFRTCVSIPGVDR